MHRVQMEGPITTVDFEPYRGLFFATGCSPDGEAADTNLALHHVGASGVMEGQKLLGAKKIRAIDLSLDGRLLVVGHGKHVSVINTQTERCERDANLDAEVTAVQFGPAEFQTGNMALFAVACKAAGGIEGKGKIVVFNACAQGLRTA
jgi:hypothetical protein